MFLGRRVSLHVSLVALLGWSRTSTPLRPTSNPFTSLGGILTEGSGYQSYHPHPDLYLPKEAGLFIHRTPNRKSVFSIFGMLIGDEYRNGPLGSEGLDVRILASFSFCCAVSVLPTSAKAVA